MRLNVSQHMRLEQQMKLAPRIIQAMEILQLPMLALQERIDSELEANPVLEMAEPGEDGEAAAEEDYAQDRGEQDMVVDESNGHSEDFERLSDLTDEYGADSFFSDAPVGRSAPAAGERDPKMDAMANTAAPGETLNEYLLGQWVFVDVDDRTRRAGELIINNLDDDGYLRVPFDDLLGKTTEELTASDLSTALRLVQTLDPVGVGARDLRECLSVQLRQEAEAGRDVSLEMELVTSFLRDIEKNRLPQIARKLGVSVERVKDGIESIARLNPRPGLLVGQRPAPIVTPEVVVELGENGEPVVTMADGNTPDLRISDLYRKIARDRGASADVRQFVRRNIRSAEWLVGAIEQRRETVRRVAEEVFKVQKDFIEEGPEALRPLPMADVAARVGVHVATVSRAVAGKYAQTPRGIYPLRMFFSGGTKTSEGEDVAWDAVKAKLREIVDAEDKTKPFSDDQLAAELEKHGLSIARRTVAKYRGLMDIPSARKRREY